MVQLLNELHVGEDRGVAGEINGAPILQVQDVARRLAAVNDLVAILNAATVDRMRHSDFQRADILRSALIHGAQVLDSLALEPQINFVVSDDVRLVLAEPLPQIWHTVKPRKPLPEGQQPERVAGPALVTLTREPNGDYYVSFTAEVEMERYPEELAARLGNAALLRQLSLPEIPAPREKR